MHNYYPRLFLALASAVLLPGLLCAQRTRTLAAGSNAGALPVTAHRQVAWSSGGVVFLWNGSTLGSLNTSGNVVSSVGFIGPNRLFFTVQGGPYYGYNVWDSSNGQWIRLQSNPIDTFHTDGNAAVFPLPGYAGFGLYTGGTSYTSFAAGTATTYQPRVHGRYVVYQRRTGTGYTDYNVYRYDRSTGTTSLASASTADSTDARIDEAGRVLYLNGGLSSGARTWFNDFTNFPRIVVDAGLGAMAYRYDAHLRQVAYSRRPYVGSGLFDLQLEDGGTTRVLDTSVDGHADLRLRGGMAAWLGSNGLRLFDGRMTTTLTTTQFSLPAEGSPLDRGWVAYGAGGGPVVLRESPLTWDRDTLSASAGGTVQLDLLAGSANAGRQYLVLASLSGTFPGLTVGGLTLPLNYDGLLAASLSLTNSAMFVNTFGVLDGTGNATARFVLPPGIASALAGQAVSFAYVLLTPSLNFPSNPARVLLTQ